MLTSGQRPLLLRYLSALPSARQTVMFGAAPNAADEELITGIGEEVDEDDGRRMAAGQRPYWYSNHQSEIPQFDDRPSPSCGRRCGFFWVYGLHYRTVREARGVDQTAFDSMHLPRTQWTLHYKQ